MKQQTFCFHNFEILESFVELFSKQTVYREITVITCKINFVERFQVLEVNIATLFW